MNILDRLPNDILYIILGFSGDQIQFNNKKNLICSDEFQNRMKMQHDDEIENYDQVERVLRKHLNITYPVSSYTINVSQHSDILFDVSIKYRELGNNVGVVSYRKVNLEKSFTVYLEEDLNTLVEHFIENLDGILSVDADIIYENLFDHQKEMLDVDDIQDLIDKGCVSVLKAICDINWVISDVIFDGDYKTIMNFDVCKEIEGLYVTA
jgi:hypothetical protein